MRTVVMWLGVVIVLLIAVLVFVPKPKQAEQPSGTNIIMATSSEVRLGVGQTGQIGNVRITFNSLVQDSRCPVDAQCIQAGAVNTNVTLSQGSTTLTKNMPSDEVPQEFGGYRISIIGVDPPRHSGQEIDKGAYTVTFHIAKK